MQKTPNVRAVDSTLSATNERRACNAQATATIQPLDFGSTLANLGSKFKVLTRGANPKCLWGNAEGNILQISLLTLLGRAVRGAESPICLGVLLSFLMLL